MNVTQLCARSKISRQTVIDSNIQHVPTLDRVSENKPNLSKDKSSQHDKITSLTCGFVNALQSVCTQLHRIPCSGLKHS